ncbi:alpha/beta hydrolase [Cereibacter azotoformans]|uniref:Alpha/beta hydrolase n=1 Tax=Cereibacter azotoformans TaxID=43057 RepID=A0A2T5JT44_9RHOB|nr:alpha/beta hydrolase [Cereibacter azotoformans]AXQ95717.1 alpha/beta hydrolase [Cereibacter sphaeroides]PTR12987.1 hypothetical protein C8J28_12344 [Cereibacter azotoformans]UIJ32783.1 alpha/beta hydrolase [Cereibacter azotoformans]
MSKVLLIPGLDGSPEPHWQHWWASTDPDALMVDLSDLGNPVPAVWEIEVAGAILQHPGSILVGHSLGALLIARLLAHWPHLDVAGALLVAPADSSRSPRTKRFGAPSETPLGVPAIVAASRNDPWMSFGRASRLAQAWGADLVDLGFAGHVNADAGFGPWPQGRKLREALEARAVPAVDPWLAPFLERAAGAHP